MKLICICHRSVTHLCPTLCDPMHGSMPGFPVLNYLLEFAQAHVHWIGDAVQPFYPLFPCLLFLPSIFPNELVLRIRWPKYWSFNISPCHEYSGLISFMIDWLDLLAVQGTHESFLQHHSSKASVIWQLAFPMVQLSHLYMTTGKNHSFD